LVVVRLISRDTRGKEETRQVELHQQVKGDDLRVLGHFQAPAPIAGTRFLLVDRASGPDEQWVYLPALKKATRLQGQGRAQAWFGADFSLEDMLVVTSEGARHSLVSETATTWVLDSQPAAGSPYARVRSTFDRGTRSLTQAEYFDAAGILLKKLTVQPGPGQGGWPAAAEMVNVAKGGSTRVELVSARVGLPPGEGDSTFTPEGMGATR
jgi:hypothetical protein